jgi:predicted TIM-barrel fold metal-dependent hydrolase
MQHKVLAAVEVEDVIAPHIPICDAHHHLWHLPNQRYLLPDFLADLSTGHNVRSSVFIEWRSQYRPTGPLEMRPVGETEFANSVAEAASGARVQACAAIIGYADLSLGAGVVPVLEAHLAAAKGRFKGIRNVASWDADPDVRGGPPISRPGLYREPAFRQGFMQLERFGLTFDAWLYQTQLGDLIDLAQAFPRQPIVLNHLGGVLGVGKYAGRRGELFSAWRGAIQDLGRCSNVSIKLSGLGMKRSGFEFHGQPERSTSKALATAWRPWMETCLEEFGAARCMFGSNFPVDRATCSYRVLWNAFKRIVASASESEKIQVLYGTATRFYGKG